MRLLVVVAPTGGSFGIVVPLGAMLQVSVMGVPFEPVKPSVAVVAHRLSAM